MNIPIRVLPFIVLVSLFICSCQPVQPIEPDKDTLSDMVFIPEGPFQMGCDSSNDDECNERLLPLHTVHLGAYYIDRHEVTNGQYRACVEVGQCTTPPTLVSAKRYSYFEDADYNNYPVITIWEQARDYCEWKGKRLPTEAEWEKAARGDQVIRVFPWGNEKPTCELVNGVVDGEPCVGDTTEVGSYPAGASPYGVMDMAGNMWEWVNDWYAEDYYGVSPTNDPQGPETGTHRVTRGGGFWPTGSAFYLRVANRTPYNPDGWYTDTGFRCASSK